MTRTGYILCSNPRSGTTLLCDLLAQTGVAGRPNSFFRPHDLGEWAEGWGVTTPVDPEDPVFSGQYLAAMRVEGQGGTPVFGLRLMAEDLDFACDWLARQHPGAATSVEAMYAAFGPLRFIHLARQDKLAEAVSYLRAQQTGLWHQRPDGTALEQLPPTATPGYDGDAITAQVTALNAQEKLWAGWFAAQGITPLRLTYEGLSDDPEGTLEAVLSHIGQDPAAARGITPGTRKLADAESAAWIGRYLRETQMK